MTTQKMTPDVCYWVRDGEDPDNWVTSCGNSFWIHEETPNDNKFLFCCYCGKPLSEGTP